MKSRLCGSLVINFAITKWYIIRHHNLILYITYTEFITCFVGVSFKMPVSIRRPSTEIATILYAAYKDVFNFQIGGRATLIGQICLPTSRDLCPRLQGRPARLIVFRTNRWERPQTHQDATKGTRQGIAISRQNEIYCAVLLACCAMFHLKSVSLDLIFWRFDNGITYIVIFTNGDLIIIISSRILRHLHVFLWD